MNRHHQRKMAVLIGAGYAFAFLLVLKSFLYATESPNPLAVGVPFLVLGALEVAVGAVVRALARSRLLTVQDLWLLVLSAVVIDTIPLGYVLIRDGGQLRQWIDVVLGAALFCFPAYYGFKGLPVVQQDNHLGADRPA